MSKALLVSINILHGLLRQFVYIQQISDKYDADYKEGLRWMQRITILIGRIVFLHETYDYVEKKEYILLKV